jgi:hypothetical protein
VNVNQHPFRVQLVLSRPLYCGAWRPAAGDGRIQGNEPSTERVIVAVPDAYVAYAAAAMEAAASAAEGWCETSRGSVPRILRRCFELMVERSETLATLMSLENGKALGDARRGGLCGGILPVERGGSGAYLWRSSALPRLVRAGLYRLPADRYLHSHHAVELPRRQHDAKDRGCPCRGLATSAMACASLPRLRVA